MDDNGDKEKNRVFAKEYRAIMLSVTCTVCGAKVGEVCVSSSGRRRKTLEGIHASRKRTADPMNISIAKLLGSLGAGLSSRPNKSN